MMINPGVLAAFLFGRDNLMLRLWTSCERAAVSFHAPRMSANEGVCGFTEGGCE